MAPLGRVVIIRRTGIDGTHFPLSRNSCLFGRGTECDIRIQLPMVSKQHCKIEMRQQEALLINLSDSIPTQLNGAHVNHPVVLKNGDIITIVDRSFRFECGHVPGGSNTTEYLEQKCKEVMEKIIKEPRSLLVPANSPELSEENSPTDTKVPLHQEDFIRKLLINIDQKVNSASLQKSAMSLGSPIISVADVSSSYDSSSGIEEKKKEQIPLQRKRVSFGGTLRPEVFDKQMPSNMPLRKGEETPKKKKFLGTQLPSILKKTIKLPMDQVPNVFSTGYGNTYCTTTAGTASVENLKVPEDFSEDILQSVTLRYDYTMGDCIILVPWLYFMLGFENSFAYDQNFLDIFWYLWDGQEDISQENSFCNLCEDGIHVTFWLQGKCDGQSHGGHSYKACLRDIDDLVPDHYKKASHVVFFGFPMQIKDILTL